jgi:DNA-binding CsgD family transcriptional regulator
LVVEHPGVWPLAGREHELRAVEAALRTDTTGVLLVGAAGVGKTRLVREVLARWVAAGGVAEWVVATRAAGAIPFGAVSHLIPAGFRLTGNPPDLLDKIADGYADARRGEHRGERLDPGRPGRAPVVVGIDDVHLLDDLSAALVRRLAARGLVTPVGSARSEEPLSAAVLAIWPDEAGRRTVPSLPPEALDQILDHALPGQIDPISRQRLHRLAGGNPLMLRELLADAVESGALARREGVWCWRGAVPASARLAELVTARLAAMSPAARSVLEMVASGEPLPLSLVARVAEAGAIEEVRRSTMVVADRSGSRVALRFAHPLYAEVLRANLPASRARRICAVLAAAQAEEPMRRRDDALLAAVWQLQSGQIRDPKLLLLAAREAGSRFDLDLAERLARAARSPAASWEADWLLARILQFRGRAEEAAQVLPGPPDSRGERLAMWAVTRACLLYWGAGQPDEALRALDAVAPTEPGGELTEASRAWILLFDGRCRHALVVASALLDRPVDERAAVWAGIGAAAAAGMLGRLGYAREVWERGTGAAATDAFPWGHEQVGYGMCLALRLAGHLREAAVVADDGYRAAVARGAGPMAGFWAALRGIVFKAQGRAVEAQGALREALVLLGEYDAYLLTRVCLAELAGACALAGDLAAARDSLARADELAGRQTPAGADSGNPPPSPEHNRHRPGANRLFDAWVELNRAWVQVAGGELSTSVEIALNAAKLAEDSEQPAYQTICLYDAARIGGAAAVGEQLREVAGYVEGRAAPQLVALTDGLATGDGPALARAASALADEGQLLFSAEAETAAARAFEQTGERAQMRRALERAAKLAGECQGVRTPLLELAGGVGLLSRREREVAVLATGQSSRQIADRLGLSVNTVNNTLARAFAKLGVSNRSELADIFRDDPLANR